MADEKKHPNPPSMNRKSRINIRMSYEYEVTVDYSPVQKLGKSSQRNIDMKRGKLTNSCSQDGVHSLSHRY